MAANDLYFPGVQIVEKSFQPSVPTDASVVAFGAFIGRADQGPTVPTEVRSWSEFTRLFGTNYGDLHYALNDFFTNGGRRAFVVRIAGANAVSASLPVYDSTVSDPLVGGPYTPLFTATAANPGVWGNSLRLVTYVRDTANKRFDVALFKLPAGVTAFDQNKRNSEYLVDQWNDVSLDPKDSRYLYSLINAPSSTGSQLITVSGQSYTATGTQLLPGVGGGYTFTLGVNGIYTSPYDEAASYNAAVQSLTDVPGPYVLNMPNMVTAAIVKSAIQNAAERGDVFVVADTAINKTPAEAVTYATTDLGLGTLGVKDPSFAAVYYPWVHLPAIGAAAPGRTLLRPPGGAVVGAYMANDVTYGVWKAPAGLNTVLVGGLALERKLTDADLTTLNNGHVNAIRSIPGVGLAVMGARTLKKFGLDMYVNVRRSIIDITENLRRLTEFSLFENNDERLWADLNTTASRFLGEFWQSGGLKGSTAQEAFFVRCDASNNTPASIAQGQVNIEVGVAVTSPAEFIVITIGHFEGSASVTVAV